MGGGRGRLIATILAEHAHLRGILFDQPHVVESARETLDEAGVADRCELVGGSFFDAVPQAATFMFCGTSSTTGRTTRQSPSSRAVVARWRTLRASSWWSVSSR